MVVLMLLKDDGKRELQPFHSNLLERRMDTPEVGSKFCV